MQMRVIREMDPSSPGIRRSISSEPHEVTSGGSSLAARTIGPQQILMILGCLTARICPFRKYHSFTWKNLLK